MKLDFGTAGIRGIVGDGEDQLNQAHAARVVDGFAKYLLEYVPDAKNRGVVIGRDNRIRGKIFANLSAQILTSYGIKVYFDNQMVATPFISFLTLKNKAAGALNITASHNPKEYNGIKVYNQYGAQMLPDEIKALKSYFLPYENYLDYFQFDQEVTNSLVLPITEADHSDYLDAIRQLNFNQVDLANLKIVYSALHGVGYQYVKELLNLSQCQIFYQNEEVQEDENFSHVVNPNPERKVAFKNSIVLANKVGADLILITDPDADRLGVAIRQNGDFVLLTGNEMAILICDYLLKNKPLDQNKTNYLIYSHVSTSLPDLMAQSKKIKVYRVDTGFKWIGNLVQTLEGQESFFFAFEESYGTLINGAISHDKDALQTLYLMAIIAAEAKKQNASLLERLEQIYHEYNFYLVAKTLNLDLPNPAAFSQIIKLFEKAVPEVNLNFGPLKTKPCCNQLNCQSHNQTTNDENTYILYAPTKQTQTLNEIEMQANNHSWIIIRPSGTEPKYKVYMHIVGVNKASAQKRFDDLLSWVKKVVEGVKIK